MAVTDHDQPMSTSRSLTYLTLDYQRGPSLVFFFAHEESANNHNELRLVTNRSGKYGNVACQVSSSPICYQNAKYLFCSESVDVVVSNQVMTFDTNNDTNTGRSKENFKVLNEAAAQHLDLNNLH